MSTLNFLEYPDKTSDIAFVVTDQTGTHNPLENDHDAANLTAALVIADVEDRQARLLIDLYQRGVVTKQQLGDLDRLLMESRPCRLMLAGLERAVEAREVSEKRADTLTSSVDKLQDYDPIVADHQGLGILEVQANGDHRLHVSDAEVLAMLYGEQSQEVETARALQANAFCFQTLVSWQPSETENWRPTLLPPYQTITYGSAHGDQFMPIASSVHFY